MEFTFLFCHFHHFHEQLIDPTTTTKRCPINLSVLFKKLFTSLPCTNNPSSPISEPEREATTILALLRDQMEGQVHSSRGRSRMSFKQRLGLKGLGCCGATWGFRPNTITDGDIQEHEEQQLMEVSVNSGGQLAPQERVSEPDCSDSNPSRTQQSSGMNLAAALAAERQFRESGNNLTGPTPTPTNNEGATVGNLGPSNADLNAPGMPLRVSLMTLLEESAEGGGVAVTAENEGGGGSSDSMCCVCMGRKKGAAFIPCGHTFCRVCSRELWLNRGFCPLCNRSILEILDIF